VSNSLSRSAQNRLSLLTPRERQVLAWLVRGATNPKIGASLKVSPRTIEKHVERILAKLSVNNRTCAAMLAAEVGRDTLD
jgi:DNA-binding NarL/FixJ family response regulator